jgi:hypothetical protein
MKLPAGLALAAFLIVTSAHADVVIDNFTGCSNSVSLTGAGFRTDGFLSCSGAIGGEHEAFILVGTGAPDSPAGSANGTASKC